MNNRILILTGTLVLLPVFYLMATPADSSTHLPAISPDRATITTSPVYIDDLKIFSDSSHLYIRVKGHLPTPCHHLTVPEHQWDHDTLSVTLSSWMETDVMCVQILEPFVYYHNISETTKHTPVRIRFNEHTISP